MANFYKEAKEYRQTGWNVIPLKNYSKNPASANSSWKDLQERMSTDEEFEKMFDRDDLTGLGLITGKVSNVYVLDEDSYKEGGRTINTPSPMLAQSASGGRHHYRQYNPDVAQIGTRDGIYVEGKGQGGFVVLPPSQAIGHDGKTVGTYSWLKKCPVDKIPMLTKEDLTGLGGEVKEKLNRNETLSVEDGNRHNTLLKLADSLWNDIRFGRITEDVGWLQFKAANSTYKPPKPDIEVERIWKDAGKFIENHPYENKKEENAVDFLIGEPISWAKIKEEGNKKDWLWEGYVAKKHSTLLSALWKAGKTTFLRCLFLAMAHEEEFAGQPTKKSKILVISEEAEGEWVDSREEVENLGDIKNVMVWSRPLRVKPNLKQWVDLIIKAKEYSIKEGVDLVVIDTLTTFWPIDNENDSAQVIKALVPLYFLTQDASVAVVLVHHFRKGGGEQAQASRGSGALPSFVDNIIEFTRSDSGFPNQRTLKTYGRFSNVIPEIVIEYTNEGKYISKGEPWQVSKSARLQKVLSIVKESPVPVNSKEILTTLTMGGISFTLRSVQNYLNELLEKSLLTKARTDVVGNKKMVFYACTGWQEALGKVTDENATPPHLDLSFRQSAKNDQKGFRQPFVSTSPASLATDETKAINAISGESFADEKLQDEKEIPFDPEDPPDLTTW